jgi:hypothetical protein
MPINVAALEAAQKELSKRTGNGGRNWIQVSKIEAPIDFRIADPLPQMNGVYFQEVKVWWVNGNRIISPKLFGPQEVDTVELALAEAKRSKDPTLLALINAKGENKMPKIQEKYEYWVPVLKFSWDLDKQGNIKGINGADGNPDPELIKQFIDDYHWKILVANITALKAINEIATKRGGAKMTDRLEGFNLILSKSGAGRDTRYSVVRDSVSLPMPEELYKPDRLVDPFEVAQSLMYTDQYMDQIIGQYLYGEECPERDDTCYAYPEIREKFKALLTDSDDTEVKETARPRPGRAAAAPATSVAPAPTRAAAPIAEAPAAPVVPQRGSVEGPVRGRPAAAARPGRPAAAPARTAGRPARNVADDLRDV